MQQHHKHQGLHASICIQLEAALQHSVRQQMLGRHCPFHALCLHSMLAVLAQHGPASNHSSDALLQKAAAILLNQKQIKEAT
jgi:hypothetical protein